MNVYKFEIKSSVKSVISWSIISVALLYIYMIVMYPLYIENSRELVKVFSAYPKEMLTSLGLDLNTVFSFNGFYGFVMMYFILALSIMACYMGLITIGREKKMKTNDFLLTKPHSRLNIFIQKYLAVVTNVLIVDIIFIGMSILSFYILDNKGSSFSDFILISFSIILVQFIFLNFGVLVATLIKKVKLPSMLSLTIVLTFFVISIVSSIIKEDWMNYITPFKYYVGNDILFNHGYELKYITLTILILIITFIVSLIKYLKSDVESV